MGRVLGALLLLLVVIGAGVFAYVWKKENFAIEQAGDLVVIYRQRQPKQPIEFPHWRHIKKVGLDCLFCHKFADKAVSPGLPPLRTCMNCHPYVPVAKDEKGNPITITPRIKKLLSYWKEKKPIPWVHVFKLPDFVYFNHKIHVKMGVHCYACHGDMTKVTVAKQMRSLRMGWCLKCHHNPQKYVKELNQKEGLNLPLPKVSKARTDCWTCHK